MLDRLAIATLVENTASGRGLLGEHGLSFLLETDSHRVLFDTGQGFVLRHNAEQLGMSLQRLDAIALSHGHYDHTGGLNAALDACGGDTELFLHPQALDPKYSPRGYIGTPLPDPDTLVRRVRRLVLTEQPTEVVPGVHLTGSIPRSHPLEDTGGSFWQDPEHQQVDALWDDQALFAEVPEGWVVLLGCAHAGVINTLDYIAELTGSGKFYALLGGMHLLRANRERLNATVEAIARYDIQQVAPVHCTGTAATAFLWHRLGDRCLDCRVGTRVQFGGDT